MCLLTLVIINIWLFVVVVLLLCLKMFLVSIPLSLVDGGGADKPAGVTNVATMTTSLTGFAPQTC